MSSLPSTMKAVSFSKTGGPDVLEYNESAPLPKVQDGEVLVKNSFAGVNFIDTYFRSGLYPAQFPFTPGQEAAGTIAKIQGDNTLGFKEGDRVVWIKVGGYAEYTAVPADKVIKIPQGVSDEDAVGSFLMGMTALSLIKEAYPVKRGETILVHAAAGGMGLILTQMLRDAGCTVIGTAGGPEKCALAKENGAHHVIDYKATSGPSWVEQVMKLTNGEGVDCTYDGVGKDTYEGSLEVAKRKSKVVYFGNASGAVPPINIARLTAKNLSIMRSTLMGYIVTRKELEYYANGVLDMVKDGKLKIKIHKVYPLAEARQAQEDLEGRRTTGKLLLKL
ncbi:NADPH2:quinone reductase [Cladophialophora yegresii CBS 114405]|uniref:Probable quinone oxidoreductase n=1 Tax=Cladophialophora yegresii CBS 114405 TaxID=1182544 RepID=W9W9E9_9EURO|nr:NADPH2:quinone reductase [Cladophialophora yegresii CBS 114405]EXJ55184.1 NADPH2:quinone reductase [Cladophialophora yegresii CBS 114405]